MDWKESVANLDRREFIITAAKGAAGIMALSHFGCGGGGGDSSNDTPRNDAGDEVARNAAMAEVNKKLTDLSGLSASEKTQEIVTYMAGMPAFQNVAASAEGGGVYAEFKENGKPFMVTLGRELRSEDRAAATLPADMFAVSSLAGMPMGTAMRIPDRKVACMAAGFDYLEAAGFDPNAPNTKATEHMAEIANMLTHERSAYVLNSLNCTYEGLKSLQNIRPAVLYLNMHTCVGENQIALVTQTPWPDQIESSQMAVDYFADMIVPCEANFIDQNDNEIWQTCVGLTKEFVQQYWEFAKDSLVYFDVCYLGWDTAGGGEPAIAFRQALQSKGAGCIVAWRGSSNGSWCYPAAKVFFDRLLGMNLKQPNTPNQRPFPPDQVYAEIKKKNLDKGDQPTRYMTLTPSLPTGGMLVPTIESLLVEERTYEEENGEPVDQSTMTLKGTFGNANGRTIKVTVNGQEMKNLQINKDAVGDIEELKCDLPMDPADKGFAGKVLVSVDDHKSNAVALTLWRWKMQQTFVENADGEVIFTQNVEWDVYLRADVHPYRTQAGGELNQPEALSFRAAPGSKVTFTFVTSGSSGLSSSPTSGTMPYGLRNVSNIIKGYIFDGQIDMKSGKITLKNLFGYPITLSNAPLPMGLLPDPSYIAVPGVSDDMEFYLESNYNIQEGDILGTLKVTTTKLHFDQCVPTYKPGDSVSLAGEDLNVPYTYTA